MLYHFTSCESLRKILLCKKIKFSKSLNLDDPFERMRSRNYLGWIPNIPESSPAARHNGYFNSLVNLTNVLCFFDGVNEANEIIDPLSDLKMWSHYGKYHRGCCLVFNKELTIAAFCTSAKDSVYEHGRVEYNDLHNYIPAHVSPFQQPGYLDLEFKRLFHSLFFNKGVQYSSESEYRFAINNKNNDFSLDVFPMLSRVVLAENASEDDVLSIVRLCDLVNVEVGRMIISNDKLIYFQVSAPHMEQ